jgi:RNA polymerase sigma-70 factor (ECF subfamily)
LSSSSSQAVNTAPTGSPTFSAKARRDFALVDCILGFRDEQAYTQLMRVYQKPIYQLVARMVPQRDIAEDLTLEVFMRAFRFLPTFKPVFAFSTWLFRLAINHCKAFLQRHCLRMVSLYAPAGENQDEYCYADLSTSEPTPHEVLVQAQRYERLHQAVSTLPPKYRTLLTLHYFKELSYEEIAERHHLPLGTVKAQLNRGRERLKRTLTRQSAALWT